VTNPKIGPYRPRTYGDNVKHGLSTRVLRWDCARGSDLDSPPGRRKLLALLMVLLRKPLAGRRGDSSEVWILSAQEALAAGCFHRDSDSRIKGNS